ncbi:hypothetical protein U14_01404 [Candidatus Moduliflexus flocculans]|uniref:Lipoprotein n=1 Tax=Candidatus Moduliflexus flocculans TaxID=1499966 RepID=A0A0S6VXG1_9BACT|nr:hypothetical protein U14_01404 [Candidatus Moduliflexus flocculans]
MMTMKTQQNIHNQGQTMKVVICILTFFLTACVLNSCFNIGILSSMVDAAEINDRHRHDKKQTSEMTVEYTERYQNPNYFYSIEIPSGYVCMGDPAPNPNHGCRINLSSTDEETYLYVDGSYNTTEFIEPFDDMMGIHLGSLFTEGMKIFVLKRDSILLDGVSAEHIVVSYGSDESKEMIVEDITVAFRSEIIYTIKLKTTHSRYETDKEFLKKILMSWKNEISHISQ